MKARLIFNPSSGNQTESAQQLLDILRYLQEIDIQCEVALVTPEMRLSQVARAAARAGERLVIVSGGDGTIENVALGLVGTATTLGIIPTGTRNNLALSLNVPSNDIPKAVGLLRQGRRLKIDVGQMRTTTASRYFLEAGAIGLASALFPAADDIQHGDLGKIGEFISTFVSHPASEIHLRLDRNRDEVVTHGHMVLIANMPYMGANFLIAPDIAYDDRQLDVFIYANLSKLDLIGKAIQLSAGVPDSNILHYRAKKVTITTEPPLSIMADGVLLGEGPVTASLEPRSLNIMAGEPLQELAPAPEPAPLAGPSTPPEPTLSRVP